MCFLPSRSNTELTLVRTIFSIVLLSGLIASPLLHAQQEGMDQRLVAAEQVYRQQGAETALPEFERLLQAFTENGDTRNAALAQGYIGECHWRMGDFDQSRDNLEHALVLKRDLGDRLQEGKTLNVIGLLEWDLGNFEQAIERFGEASAIGKALGDRKLEGATLNNLSMVYDELGDYRTSLRQYEQVLEIYSGADFPRGEGDTLGNIGGVHLLLGHYSKAVEYYQQALKISEQLESVPAMSQDHGNLGLSYTGLGRIDVALQHFEEALKLAEQAGMRQEQGLWLRGKANAQIKSGRYDLGLESHRAALEIYAEVDAQPLLVEALHDMGQLYLELGDPGSAEQYFQRALELARSIDLSRGITINLIALGDVQYFHERLEEAAAFYFQAAQRCKETGEQGIQGEALLRLARAHRLQQGFEQARQEAGEALAIARETGARTTEAMALLTQAELDREQANVKSALGRYAEAEKLSAAIADPDLLWQIDYGRALALVQDDQKEAAVTALLKAIGYIENVRNRLRENRFRAGYIQDKHQVYIELVRLQLELGQVNKAFLSAERLRAWSYNEQTEYREVVTRTEEQRLVETEMRERIRQLQSLIEVENSQVQADRRQMALDTFSLELMIAEQEYESFLDDIGGQQFTGTKPGIPADQARLRRVLRPTDALIEYVVGADNIMIFVLTAESLQATSVAMPQVNLRSRLELLRDLLLQVDNDRWKKPAASLSKTLLEPLWENGWLEGVKHLYLVPHGMLNYLPIALLPIETGTGQRSVIETYTLAYLPAASTLENGVSGSDEIQSLLVMAPTRSHLRHAPQESAAIGELFQPRALSLVGDMATESTFKNIAGNYQVLHLATHGYFNKLNPLLSGLELEPDEANDGMLEVHEILGLRLESDLVTLSACETGMGSGYFAEIPAGDDFVGLTRAFLDAGSASVLATLWQVDDRSTVELMKIFYGYLKGDGKHPDKTAALAAAQRAMRVSDKYRHPYYWAPFILVNSIHKDHSARG
jgi:CHAT domain-containing protein/Tfp pilus assembly protein PilF